MSELQDRVIAYNAEIKEALQAVLGEMNRGQRKKLLKNPVVKAMMERYGINTMEDDVTTGFSMTEAIKTISTT